MIRILARSRPTTVIATMATTAHGAVVIAADAHDGIDTPLPKRSRRGGVKKR
jgi:hypothetical protein